MVQILEDAPSFAQQMARGLGSSAMKFGEGALEGYQEKKKINAENESIKQQFGVDLSGIKDPKTRNMAVEYMLKGQLEDRKQFHKKMAREQDHSVQQSMSALDQMESMLDESGIGMGGGISSLFYEDSRFNRGKFESLQAALMPLFKSMFPKGMTQNEFAHVNEHYIPQLGDTTAKIRGKISGLRKLMGNQSSDSLPTVENMGTQERPSLSSFSR